MPCRTYSTLVSHVKGSSRLDQVVSWVGPDFDGPLIFDECHKSKNFVPGKEAQSTRVQSPPWAQCLSSVACRLAAAVSAWLQEHVGVLPWRLLRAA